MPEKLDTATLRALMESPTTRWWLDRVELERFKAASNADIALMPFTVIIGRNGSGKSTLLEALQWLDTAIRRDVRDACDRYYGVHDLINKRFQEKNASPYFGLHLQWKNQEVATQELRYNLVIEEGRDLLPRVSYENLVRYAPEESTLVETSPPGRRVIRKEHVERVVTSSGGAPEPAASAIVFDRNEELALRYTRQELPDLRLVDDFWFRAVFLRLSPSRLAQRSAALRKSFEPILDEEGQTLPALLNELTGEQREELVANLRELLPGIEDLEVSRPDVGQHVYYSLHEKMFLPLSGGRTEPVPIPAWMLSEGTRRLTAILALLVREPSPSLICIEEIENGLDPWTVRAVLQHLQSAVERGIQVIMTTHSPWLLDAVPMDSIIQVRRVDGESRYEHFASRPEIHAYDPSIPPGTRYVNEAE